MFLSFLQVLCLPLDVFNVRGGNLGFSMDTVWKIIYISTAIYLFFLNPLISSFYEADEDDSIVTINFFLCD
jgi:hypothetical protein